MAVSGKDAVVKSLLIVRSVRKTQFKIAVEIIELTQKSAEGHYLCARRAFQIQIAELEFSCKNANVRPMVSWCGEKKSSKFSIACSGYKLILMTSEK